MATAKLGRLRLQARFVILSSVIINTNLFCIIFILIILSEFLLNSIRLFFFFLPKSGKRKTGNVLSYLVTALVDQLSAQLETNYTPNKSRPKKENKTFSRSRILLNQLSRNINYVKRKCLVWFYFNWTAGRKISVIRLRKMKILIASPSIWEVNVVLSNKRSYWFISFGQTK